jgi:hypothetical protein
MIGSMIGSMIDSLIGRRRSPRGTQHLAEFVRAHP